MRKILNVLFVFAILTCTTDHVFSQVKKKGKSPFGIKTVQIYGGASFQMATFPGAALAMPGINAGLLFNNRIAGGAAYYRGLGGFVPNVETENDVDYTFQYGGGYLEYFINPNSKVSFSIPLLVGAGELRARRIGSDEPFAKRNWDNLILVHPGIKANFNLIERISLGLEANYRIMQKINFREQTNSDYNGAGVIGSVKYIFN